MGEVFAGRYELVDPIGRGGVGAVWRAWDQRRRRYVAAKVLQQRNAHTLLRFVREQALRIDHPHVLAPASWAADDDQVLFTMDLVTGGSLAHVIGDYGALSPRFCCTLLDQLLAGLAAVHAEGVVHRDIKPANILLDATGTGRPHLRLSDFGISMRKGEPRLTETDYVVGTPGYFAPEQMLGAEPDFTADLFAVGLVALYLLQGAKPDSKALIEHFAAHGTPGAPRGVPEPLWQVIATLLQPDPQARFRTATGARKALASATEMLPELGPDDELVEIFDQLGPLPEGFGPDGPLTRAPKPPPPQPPPPQLPASQQSSARLPAARPPVSPAHTPPPPPGRPVVGQPSADPSSAGRPFLPQRPVTEPSAPSVPQRPAMPPPSLPPHPLVSETGSFPLPPPTQAPPQPAQPPTPPGPTPLPPPVQEPPVQEPPSHPAAHAHVPPAHPPLHPLHPVHPPHPLHSEHAHAASPSPRQTTPAEGDPSPVAGSSVQRAYASAPTSPYTAHPAQVPLQSSAIPGPLAQVEALPRPPGAETEAEAEAPQAEEPSRPRATRSHAARPPRTGPPAKVALPMLLAALVCFAVGFWALTRI
ncbi:serine/threonine-protein kinase [Streptomyces spectabilis]|uniref:non-specific serine/threonine protein kinase n=1 Tax=Streptomyces spectabilis TaxID=68270 RepID=A0A516RA91_STRST|nr:serine/threonine-protein kinase [Streptomyces spectabilis]QDQ12577.1 serine/threonine protein kinase [Streptomyces spectabilis]